MGLFSWIGRGIGKLVEKAGDLVDSDTLRKVGRGIQELCSEKVANESSYDKQTANFHSTERLAEILAEFSKGLFDKGSSYEKFCIKNVEIFYNKLVEAIKSVPDFSQNSQAELIALRNEGRRIKNSIDKSIVNHLSKRVSLDDRECLEILKMSSGEEKKQRFSSFTDKVIKEALDALADNVRNSLKDCIDGVCEYLQNVSERQEKELSQLRDSFKKMCRSNNMKAEEREKLCVTPMIIISEIDQIEAFLGDKI